MGVGVVLWIVGKRFLVKHVVDGMLPSPVTDPSAVLSDVLVHINPYLHYFLWEEIPSLKGIHLKWRFLGPS
jgi:N-acetylglucosamine-6-phosphate deacetylase